LYRHLSATMNPLLFSLAKNTDPNFPFPSGFPIRKSSRVHCFGLAMLWPSDDDDDKEDDDAKDEEGVAAAAAVFEEDEEEELEVMVVEGVTVMDEIPLGLAVTLVVAAVVAAVVAVVDDEVPKGTRCGAAAITPLLEEAAVMAAAAVAVVVVVVVVVVPVGAFPTGCVAMGAYKWVPLLKERRRKKEKLLFFGFFNGFFQVFSQKGFAYRVFLVGWDDTHGAHLTFQSSHGGGSLWLL